LFANFGKLACKKFENKKYLSALALNGFG